MDRTKNVARKTTLKVKNSKTTPYLTNYTPFYKASGVIIGFLAALAYVMAKLTS